MLAAVCIALFSSGWLLGVRFGWFRARPDIVAAHGEPRWAGEPAWSDFLMAAVSIGLAVALVAGWLA